MTSADQASQTPPKSSDERAYTPTHTHTHTLHHSTHTNARIRAHTLRCSVLSCISFEALGGLRSASAASWNFASNSCAIEGETHTYYALHTYRHTVTHTNRETQQSPCDSNDNVSHELHMNWVTHGCVGLALRTQLSDVLERIGKSRGRHLTGEHVIGQFFQIRHRGFATERS